MGKVNFYFTVIQLFLTISNVSHTLADVIHLLLLEMEVDDGNTRSMMAAPQMALMKRMLWPGQIALPCDPQGSVGSEITAYTRLSFDQRINIVKWHCKFENVVEVQPQWRLEYAIEPPTSLAIARIRDSLKLVQRVTCKRDDEAVLFLRLWCWTSSHARHKSKLGCARVTGISRTSVLRISKQQNGRFSSHSWSTHWMKKTSLIDECSTVLQMKTRFCEYNDVVRWGTI